MSVQQQSIEHEVHCALGIREGRYGKEGLANCTTYITHNNRATFDNLGSARETRAQSRHRQQCPGGQSLRNTLGTRDTNAPEHASAALRC